MPHLYMAYRYRLYMAREQNPNSIGLTGKSIILNHDTFVVTLLNSDHPYYLKKNFLYIGHAANTFHSNKHA